MGIFLDLSAAFGTIHHGILLRRLSDLGLNGPVLGWFCYFLADGSEKLVLRRRLIFPVEFSWIQACSVRFWWHLWSGVLIGTG